VSNTIRLTYWRSHCTSHSCTSDLLSHVQHGHGQKQLCSIWMKRRFISELMKWRPAHTASFETSVVFSGTYELTHDPLILADGVNKG